MSKKRIHYQNWIAESGINPDNLKNKGGAASDFLSEISLISIDCIPELLNSYQMKDKRQTELQLLIQQKVKDALNSLPEKEREFIKLFYHMGKTYREISELSDMRVHRLESIHARAIKRLKKSLAIFVKERFSIESEESEKDASLKTCPLCNSKKNKEINELINNRDKTDTWKPIVKILKDSYSIKLKTIQILIGHDKYHI